MKDRILHAEIIRFDEPYAGKVILRQVVDGCLERRAYGFYQLMLLIAQGMKAAEQMMQEYPDLVPHMPEELRDRMYVVAGEEPAEVPVT